MAKSLQEYILEVVASESYKKKERVRELVQHLIKDQVDSGIISTPDELKELFDNINLSLTALKMVPLDVWKRS